MKSFLILGCSVLAGFFLIVPGNLSAQGRGGMAAAPHGAPAAVPHAMPAARPAGSLAGSGAGHPVVHAAPVSGARVAPGHGAARAGSGNMRVRTVNGVPHIVVRRSNGIAPIMTPPISSRGRHMAPESVFDEDENPNFRTVPGLGFDFPHLAAVFGPDAVGGGRHHQRFDGVGSFVPFFDGGFFLPQEPVVEEEAGSDQTATTQDQPEKTERNSESASRSRYEAPSRSPEPPPDSSQYVFVKRDGTLVFAVAYSWENENTLKYVTNQGLWGTVSRDALDLDATTQFNQQRGLSFQAPTSATRG